MKREQGRNTQSLSVPTPRPPLVPPIIQPHWKPEVQDSMMRSKGAASQAHLRLGRPGVGAGGGREGGKGVRPRLR